MKIHEMNPTEPYPRGKATGTYASYMNDNRICRILRKAKHPIEFYSPQKWQSMTPEQKQGLA